MLRLSMKDFIIAMPKKKQIETKQKQTNKKQKILERIRTYNITCCCLKALASVLHRDKWGINSLFLKFMIKYSCIKMRAIHGSLHRMCNVSTNYILAYLSSFRRVFCIRNKCRNFQTHFMFLRTTKRKRLLNIPLL